LQEGQEHRRLRALGQVHVLAVFGDADHLDACSVAQSVMAADGAGVGAEHLARELPVDDRYGRRFGVVVPVDVASGQEGRSGGAEVSGGDLEEEGPPRGIGGPEVRRVIMVDADGGPGLI
jgi:hypothetical protein